MAAVSLEEEMEKLGLCRCFPRIVVQASLLNIHPCIILDLNKVMLKHLLSVKFNIDVVVHRGQMSYHLTSNIC